MGNPTRKIVHYCPQLVGSLDFANGEQGLKQTTVETGGSPGATGLDDGVSSGFTIALDATDEVQAVAVTFSDILSFQLNKIKKISFDMKVVGVTANTIIVAGVGSEYNATHDAVAEAAWFRMQGSDSTSLVVVETDDGTVNNDDVATGASLANVWKHCEIDFANGLSKVQFRIGYARVALTTTFDMSNAPTQNMQPYFGVTKASSTDAPSMQVRNLDLEYQI